MGRVGEFLHLLAAASAIHLVLGHHEEYGLGPDFQDIEELLHEASSRSADPWRDLYPLWTPAPSDIRDGGSPLQLVGRGPGAREEARVTGPLGEVEGYSGYLMVDPKYNSSFFFWYFPSEKGVEASPLLLWLQGGPGATSLFGLFTEIGPYQVTPEGQLKPRQISWHKEYSLLFIDSPVGTGYSFTDSDEGYCTNQDQVAKHLYKGLQEFYNIFPEVKKQPLIITGESYAGKHIPSLATEIHKNKATDSINLRGFAIGNPFIDPPENVAYSRIGSVLGLIDTPTRRSMERLEAAIALLIKKGQKTHAHSVMSMNLYLFMMNSNYSNIYNLLNPHERTLEASFIDYIQSPEARASLHVGNTPFKNIGKVYEKLTPDFMNSGLDYLRNLSGHYPILLYSGHMDIIVAYPFTRKVVETLHGPCPHQPWHVNGRLAGYKHRCGHIELALVHSAGHMVPTDQPEAALNLINDFVTRATIGLITDKSK